VLQFCAARGNARPSRPCGPCPWAAAVAVISELRREGAVCGGRGGPGAAGPLRWVIVRVRPGSDCRVQWRQGWRGVLSLHEQGT
jgi:hypothetical protein